MVPEEISEARGMIAVINARKEEQEKAVGLVALNTPEQEGDAKVPEENSEAKGRTAIINAKYQGEEVEEQAMDLAAHNATMMLDNTNKDHRLPEQMKEGSPVTVPPASRQRLSRGGRRQLPGRPIAQYLHLHVHD